MGAKIFLAIAILTTARDPPFVLIVENYSDNSINFKVNTKEAITFDSIYYSDSLVSNELIKLNTIHTYFNKRLEISLIDSLTYQFILNPKHEILIFPSTIGIPFKAVSYERNGKSLCKGRTRHTRFGTVPFGKPRGVGDQTLRYLTPGMIKEIEGYLRNPTTAVKNIIDENN